MSNPTMLLIFLPYLYLIYISKFKLHCDRSEGKVLEELEIMNILMIKKEVKSYVGALKIERKEALKFIKSL